MVAKIGVIVGYTGAVLQTIGKAVQELQKTFPIEVNARHHEHVDAEFLQYMREEADAILLNINTSDENFGLIKETVQNANKPVFSMYDDAQLSNVPVDDLALSKKYFIYGGTENIKNLLLYIARYCGLFTFSVPSPKEMPWNGIYHPDIPEVFESVDEYLRWYKEAKSKSVGGCTVGLLLHRSTWLEDNLSIINAVIREFERRGINVIPVFSHGFGSPEFEIEGNEAVLEKYFIKDGKVIIDILVSFRIFFLVPRVIKGHTDFGFRIIQQSNSGVHILNKLNVPVIQALNSYYMSLEEWKESENGLDPIGIVISVAMPEFDGTIEPIFIGGVEKFKEDTVGGTYNKHIPEEKQVLYLVDRCIKWINLKKKDNSEKRVAIILHNAPCKSVEATVGSGFGLDTLESVAILLKRMQNEGYYLGAQIPGTGKELINLILEKKALSEFRWTPLSEIVNKGGCFLLPKEKYLEWFKKFPEKNRNELIETWGDPNNITSESKSADLSSSAKEDIEWTKLSMGLHNSNIVIPGLQFGNVFIAIQPKRGCAGARCDGEVCKILHDPTCPPPHQWLAVYKWIEKEFKADAIVHVGTHGLLEFLPGKGVGLSPECYPELSIGAMPHLYIYTVSNPMEGIIAKRRGYATLIDHLIPVMAPSGLYEGLEELNNLLAEYNKAKLTNDKARLHSIFHLIVDKAKEINLLQFAKKKKKEFREKEEFIEYLHGQLTLLRETQIRDGLHILGEAPKGKDLANLLVSILRFDIGEHPSIRRCILECLGLNYEDVVENPTFLIPELGKTNGELLEESTDVAVKIMVEVVLKIETNQSISENEIVAICKEEIGELKDQEKLNKLVEVIKFGVSLIPKIVKGTEDEINNLLRGFNSEYIEAGASGALTRGKIEVLPTGRNFYAIDHKKIPTQAAFKIGIKLAETLIKTTKYPENIGFTLWSTDIYRADGEEVAQILYTMGARPVWSENGTVRSVEVIPLNELGRPRIDCTVRISGILRDSCPNIIELIDEAVQKISALDEPLEMNYVKKHTLEKMKRLLGKYEEKTARRKATYRVFGTKPGAYGTGVNLAVFASAWKEEKDLAEVFIDWSGYAYGKEVFGEKEHTEFADLLKSVEITYFKKESDEFDVLDCCCNFAYHGGLTVAAKSVSGKEIEAHYGDTRDPDRPTVRDMKEEIERVVRTRLLNPKWIEGKKRHGYKGASDISKRVDHVYGWSATTKLVDNWIFDEITETFVLDEEMRKWFKENNPYALEEMTRRLFEAAERELWKPEEEMLNKLKSVYLDLEGIMEESLGVIEGEYQGGDIVVKTKEDIKDWK